MKRSDGRDLRRVEGFDIGTYFDLDRYARVCDLDAGGWVQQLSFRYMLGKFVLNEDQVQHQIDELKLMVQVLAAPLGRGEGFMRSQPFLRKIISTSVWDLSIYDLWYARSRIEAMDDARIACEEYDELISRECFDRIPALCQASYWGHLSNVSSPDRDCWINVELGDTDEQILNDFKVWLSEKRRAMERLGVPKARANNFSSKDFKEWADKRVLAYIDLELFAETLHGRFTDKWMGELLFPDEADVDVTERIRKVVRPCARMLMSAHAIGVLDAQAADDARRAGNIEYKVFDAAELAKAREQLDAMKGGRSEPQ